MELLIHKGKYGLKIWDVSSQYKKEDAFRALFKELNELGCYSDLKGFKEPFPNKQSMWYYLSQEGSIDAIMRLLRARQAHEYEEWFTTETEN